MSREAGGTAVMLVGLLLVRLVVADVYQRYVRVELGPLLLIAGVLLIGLGTVAVARGLRRSATGDGAATGDASPAVAVPAASLGAEHHHGDRVGWLLLVPVVALLLAPPPALGSFAGRTVELTGFVARPQDGDGFRLARFQISCCAADAVAAVVRVIDPGHPAPSRDSWLTVTGEFRGVGPDGIPELDAASMQPQEVPVDPYE